jgi:hypothetical protein
VSDDIVLINIPGPGDPSAVEVVDVSQDDGIVTVPSGGLDQAAVQDWIDDSITAHILDPTPHPAYDDGPSLLLLFENGLI